MEINFKNSTIPFLRDGKETFAICITERVHCTLVNRLIKMTATIDECNKYCHDNFEMKRRTWRKEYGKDFMQECSETFEIHGDLTNYMKLYHIDNRYEYTINVMRLTDIIEINIS